MHAEIKRERPKVRTKNIFFSLVFFLLVLAWRLCCGEWRLEADEAGDGEGRKEGKTMLRKWIMAKFRKL